VRLDNYGARYMGVGALLTLEPDIIKLDRVMIAGVHQDKRRQAIVQSLVRLGTALGVTVIAEGLETAEEIAFVRDAGVRWGQGYALGRPHREPAAPIVEVPSQKDRLNRSR